MKCSERSCRENPEAWTSAMRCASGCGMEPELNLKCEVNATCGALGVLPPLDSRIRATTAVMSRTLAYLLEERW